MITGLIVPVTGPLQIIELEAMNRRAYAAALGGRLYEPTTAGPFSKSIDVFTSAEPRDPAPANGRAGWFTADGVTRGDALIVGAGGTDVPPGFLRYLKDQGFGDGLPD